MSSNLTNSPYPDVVQRALAFEPRKRTFHGLPLGIQGFPLRRVLALPFLSDKSFVGWRYLNDGCCPIRVTNKVEQRLPGVPFVGQDIARPKITGDKFRFSQDVGRSLCIVNVACADVTCYWKLCFAVHKQMQLPPVGKLLGSLGAFFDRPSTFGVSLGRLATVTPSFERCRIQGHPVAKAGNFSVAPPNQCSGNILEFRCRPVLGQISKKATKSCFMGNGIRGVDSAGGSNVGVISQGTEQCRRGFQPKDILCNKTTPQRLYRMALGTTASRPLESSQKWRVIEAGKDGFKLVNDWRSLSLKRSGCMMKRDHGKLIPSCWFRSRRRLYRLRLRCFFRRSLLRDTVIVNSFSVNNPTNLVPICYGKSIERGVAKSDSKPNLGIRRISSPIFLTAVTDLLYNVKSPRVSSFGWVTDRWGLSAKLGPAGFFLFRIFLVGRLASYFLRSLDTFLSKLVCASGNMLEQVFALYQLRIKRLMCRTTIRENPLLYQPLNKAFGPEHVLRLVQPIQEYVAESRIASISVAIKRRRLRRDAECDVTHRDCSPNLSQVRKQFRFPSHGSFTMCLESFDFLLGELHGSYCKPVSSMAQVGIED